MNCINHLPGQNKLKDWFFFNLLQSGVFGELQRVLSDDAIVLDIGCASGVRWLSRYHAIGVDLSFGSLRGTTEFYELAIQARADDLPLASGSIDTIYSSYFLEHVPPEGKDACLRELARCLKPGGSCVLLFDVLSDGPFGRLARRDAQAFHRGFVEKDGHIGLELTSRTIERLTSAGLEVTKAVKFGTTQVQYMSSYQWLDAAYGASSWAVRLLGGLSRRVASNRFGVAVDAAITAFDRAISAAADVDEATRTILVARKPVR